MWARIKQLFAAPKPPQRPYVHPSLGTFDFDTDLGWKRVYNVDGRTVEIVIGSDGEIPSTEMANTAEDWALHWDELRPSVLKFIDDELSTWQPDWFPTSANRLSLSSINVLWPDSPMTTMLYFEDPEDDIRCWHATYCGREPQGFAFDD